MQELSSHLDAETTLWGLFAAAFLSSTLLPGGSEALLSYLSHTQSHPVWMLLSVATLGNTLGALSSYALGALIRWKFPLHPHKTSTQKAMERIHRHGAPVLLLSWLPIIGDPLCLAAGYLRLPLASSTIYIATGKALRYALVIFITSP